MILARDDVFIKERTDLRYWDESTWAEVSIKSSSGKKHSSEIIACLYRPPTADTIQFGDAIETALNKLSTSHPVILTGDFNATSPPLESAGYLQPGRNDLGAPFLITRPQTTCVRANTFTA